MSGFDWSNDALIANIKRRASVPTAQPLFEDSDFLAFADDEMLSVIFPMMMEVNGDYFVTNFDQTMSSEREYAIPSDAVGLKLKNVFWVDDHGDEFEIPLLTQPYNQVYWIQGPPCSGFDLKNNSIILYPSSQNGVTLRMQYFKRASKLIPNIQAGKIVDAETSNIELDNVPVEWEVGDELTLIEGTPGFQNLATELEITSLNPPIITLTNNGAFVTLEAGQWLALRDESPIAQITPEAIPVLAQAVAVKCLEALGDPGLAVSQAKFQQIKENVEKMLRPRVQQQVKKVVNREGILSFSSLRRWWY